MRKLLFLAALVALAVPAQADEIPPFTCSFNCWHAVVSGARPWRVGIGPNGEVLPEEIDPIAHIFASSRNDLCGSCGADPDGPLCGYATKDEALACVQYYVRNGVPAVPGSRSQAVYPYLGGMVTGPEGFPVEKR